MLFIHFASVNNLPGFSIKGNLFANELNKLPELHLIWLHFLKFPKKEIFDVTINTEVLPKGCSDKKVCWKMQQSYKRTPLMLKCDFKLKLQCNFIEITQHHWCSLAAKFAEFIQNTFLKENLLKAASVNRQSNYGTINVETKRFSLVPNNRLPCLFFY